MRVTAVIQVEVDTKHDDDRLQRTYNQLVGYNGIKDVYIVSEGFGYEGNQTAEDAVIRLYDAEVATEDAEVDQNDPAYDDDPQCTNCGVYRSEHALLRAADCDGFTTQRGGSIVYTSDDLAEMTFEEQAEAFGWDDRDEEEDEPDVQYICTGCGAEHEENELRIFADGAYTCPTCGDAPMIEKGN
jgi:DNA-directed RNA polymerase subunit RPC12/RpoP